MLVRSLAASKSQTHTTMKGRRCGVLVVAFASCCLLGRSQSADTFAQTHGGQFADDGQVEERSKTPAQMKAEEQAQLALENAHKEEENLWDDGWRKFKDNKAPEAIRKMEDALKKGHPKDQAFQRGIVLYDLGRFQEAAAQFRDDVKHNPTDSEAAIWATLCEAKIKKYLPDKGVAEARKRMPAVPHDTRRVLRDAYQMFADKEEEDHWNSELQHHAMGSAHDHDQFYAAFYLGLFQEMRGFQQVADSWYKFAMETFYGKQEKAKPDLEGDIMVAVAGVFITRKDFVKWDNRPGCPADREKNLDAIIPDKPGKSKKSKKPKEEEDHDIDVEL